MLPSTDRCSLPWGRRCFLFLDENLCKTQRPLLKIPLIFLLCNLFLRLSVQMDNGNMYIRMSRSFKGKNPRNWEFSPVFRTTSNLNPLVLSLQVGWGCSHPQRLRSMVKVQLLKQNHFPAQGIHSMWDFRALGALCVLPLCSSTLHIHPHQLRVP